MPKRIGITGNMGAGKSTLSDYLRAQSQIVIDADAWAHTLLDTNYSLKEDVVGSFGEQVIEDGDGKNWGYYKNGKLHGPVEISRKKLGEIVFSDKKKLNQLNTIFFEYLEEKFSVFEKYFLPFLPDKTVFIDAALIIEWLHTPFFEFKFDEIIVVAADDKIRLKRLVERTGLSEEKILQRMSFQMPQEEKIKGNTFIWNNGTKEELYQSYNLLFKTFV